MAPKIIRHIKSGKHYLYHTEGRYTDDCTPEMVIYYPLYEKEGHEVYKPWIRTLRGTPYSYEQSRREGGPRFVDVKPTDLSEQEREVLHTLILKLQDDLDLIKSLYIEPEVMIFDYVYEQQYCNGPEVLPIALEVISDITPYEGLFNDCGYAVERKGGNCIYLWDKLKRYIPWEKRYLTKADVHKVRDIIERNMNRPQIEVRTVKVRNVPE